MASILAQHTMQVGMNGVTQTVLSACMDILMKHQIVCVRLGDGSGLERKETAKALEILLDAVCISQIGYTVSLYRKAGLPRPSNCPSNVVVHDVEEEAVPDKAVSGKGSEGKAKRKKKVATKPQGPKPPPEFEVL